MAQFSNPIIPNGIANINPGTTSGLLASDTTAIKRNEQWYNFDIYIQDFSTQSIGSSGSSIFADAKKISPLAITELVIEEDLLTWYQQGYIVIQSSMDGFELKAPDYVGGFVPTPHNFRMDARDLLIVNIQPLVGDPAVVDTKNNAFGKPEDWELRFIFSIYDVEDIQTQDAIVKLKKLYFRELSYQLLSECKLQFSTNTLPGAMDPTGRVDNLVSTGTALSALLIACNDSTVGFGGVSGGWGDFIAVSQTNWDAGASQIFFTAPTTYSALDSAYYILDRHVSQLGTGSAGSTSGLLGALAGPAGLLAGAVGGSLGGSDLCLFNINRYTKEFELTPFTKLFEFSTNGSQPGKYQIEHFFIPILNQDPVPGMYKAPLAQNNDISIDSKLANYGFIAHYQFVDMVGGDSAKAITSRPVFSYDFKNHQFYCEYKDHAIPNTKNYFKSNYTDKMYGAMGGKPSPIFTLNKLRSTFKSLTPTFSTKNTKESRFNDGRNQVLYAAIYLNECISFTCLGATKRTAGKFIGIDKDQTKASDNPFDYKLLGQWLTTNVKHIFTQDSYNNEIQCVKIQSFKDLKINENVV